MKKCMIKLNVKQIKVIEKDKDKWLNIFKTLGIEYEEKKQDVNSMVNSLLFDGVTTDTAKLVGSRYDLEQFRKMYMGGK